ncbi:helix-turn-helix domain-containing protein [Streptomyces torulosus]|uniref:helix-turn-helix domain-containing protein n=1 Tax=Streptomyces torulosus TaxID=68276 RepID=UPI0006EBAE78|nr:GAF domain-containing protein [Streptomyces torulosus]
MTVPTDDTGLMAVLELLSEQAPASRFDQVLQRARRDGATDEELIRLERAVRLARGVQAWQGQRRQREDGLADLVDTATDLASPHDVDSLLQVVTRKVKRLINFDMTSIALLEPEGGLRLYVSDGSTTALVAGHTIPAPYGLGHPALAARAPLWTADYLDDDTLTHDESADDVVRAEGLRAMLAVPICNGEQTVGVLYGAARSVRYFSPDEIGLVSSLAALAAVAIERAGSFEQAQGEVGRLELDGFRTRTSLVRLRQLNEAHSHTLGLLLAGADFTTVAKAAGDALDSALHLRDPAGRPLAASGDLGELDESAVAEAALDAHAQLRPVVTAGGVWVAPVTAGAENLGVLVLRPTTALVGEDEGLLRLTAQTFAIQLLLRRSTAVAEGLVRDDLFDELLAAGSRSGHQTHYLVQRARRLGIDLEAPHVLLVARPEGGEQGRAVVWASSYAHRMSGLKTVHSGNIVLLLPGSDASAAARAVADQLSPLLGHPVSVGTAGPGRGAAGIGRMYKEAVRCLDALTALDGAGGTASAKDLGFLGLLLSDDYDVDGYIRCTIGPVLDYDRDRLTDLTGTLEAYFASGGSQAAAADRLTVHPNTVSRRLDRVTDLLGDAWQQPGRTLEVQLALRLHRSREVLRRQRRAATEAQPEASSVERPLP